MSSWQVVNADVLDWSASYDGPKFHAMLCDPPYHLTEASHFTSGGFGNPRAEQDQEQRKVRGRGFMGKAWDGGDIAYRPETWAALARHLHPGAFVMAFASSRGWHRLAVAIEDAGLIIQPSIFGWATGQSFPKATRIDVAIDCRAGKLEEREVVGHKKAGKTALGQSSGWNPHNNTTRPEVTIPATDLARAWVGHRYGGQVLKNALEPIICAQVPWTGKRLDCIVDTGAGALNVDGGRVAANGDRPLVVADRGKGVGSTFSGGLDGSLHGSKAIGQTSQGRWPPNFTLQHDPGCQRVGVRKVKTKDGTGCNEVGEDGAFDDGKIYGAGQGVKAQSRRYMSDGTETVADWRCTPTCPVYRLGRQSGELKSGGKNLKHSGDRGGGYEGGWGPQTLENFHPGDTGTAARFFRQSDWSYEVAERLALADPVRYQAKASRRERDAGLDKFEGSTEYLTTGKGMYTQRRCSIHNAGQPSGSNTYSCGCPVIHTGETKPRKPQRNPHPTVKPIALTRWLATLLLPPPEYAPRRLLVPFAGTGSEAIGALLAGWDEVVMVDNNAEYCRIAEARTKWWAGWSKQADTAEPKEILQAGNGQAEPDNEQARREGMQLGLGMT